MNTITKLMTAWNLSESDTRDIIERLDAETWAGGEDLQCIMYAGVIDNPDNQNKICGHSGYWIADHGGHIAYITNGDPFWCDWSEGCANDLGIEWGAFMAIMQRFRLKSDGVTNLTFDDVRELAKTAPDTVLVLHYESTDDATGYLPVQLLEEVENQAALKVKDGEFTSIEEARKYIESIAYICTQEDFENEQAEQDDCTMYCNGGDDE